MGEKWMLTKSGSTFYVMGLYDLIQLGHGMVNYYIYQVCQSPKNMFSLPWMIQNMMIRLEDMIRDVGDEPFVELHGYKSMSSDIDTPLYPGPPNFTRLLTVLRLMNLKTING